MVSAPVPKSRFRHAPECQTPSISFFQSPLAEQVNTRTRGGTVREKGAKNASCILFLRSRATHSRLHSLLSLLPQRWHSFLSLTRLLSPTSCSLRNVSSLSTVGCSKFSRCGTAQRPTVSVQEGVRRGPHCRTQPNHPLCALVNPRCFLLVRRPGKETARAGQILDSGPAFTPLHTSWPITWSATLTSCEENG